MAWEIETDEFAKFISGLAEARKRAQFLVQRCLFEVLSELYPCWSGCPSAYMLKLFKIPKAHPSLSLGLIATLAGAVLLRDNLIHHKVSAGSALRHCGSGLIRRKSEVFSEMLYCVCALCAVSLWIREDETTGRSNWLLSSSAWYKAFKP